MLSVVRCWLTFVSSTLFNFIGKGVIILDFSTLTIDTAQVLVLAGVIVTAIAGIWAVKKVIKLANRS